MNKTLYTHTDNVKALVLLAGRQPQLLRIMKQLGLSLLLVLTLGNSYAAQLTTARATQQASIKSEESHIWITIGERRFAVTLADTEAAREFFAMLPLTLDMDDLNGNEKHAELPKALPTNKYQPKTIKNGDLVLWGSRTLVVFYKTFDTSYSYTRIGSIESATNLQQELGRSIIRIEFSNH